MDEKEVHYLEASELSANSVHLSLMLGPLQLEVNHL